MCDAIVPAESILVQKRPGISHPEGERREKRCENAPAPQPASGGAPVEPGQFKSCQTQARRSARVDDQQVLISGPECTGKSDAEFDHLESRWANRYHLPKDESE